MRHTHILDDIFKQINDSNIDIFLQNNTYDLSEREIYYLLGRFGVLDRITSRPDTNGYYMNLYSGFIGACRGRDDVLL